jgi:CRISPR-associated protein Cas2
MSAADYVFAYDVTDDRERARVSKLLAGYGFRAQKSVFECRLTRTARDTLLRRIEALQLETGFVSCYALAANARRRCAGAAASPAFQPDDCAFILDSAALPGLGPAQKSGARSCGVQSKNGPDAGGSDGRASDPGGGRG